MYKTKIIAANPQITVNRLRNQQLLRYFCDLFIGKVKIQLCSRRVRASRPRPAATRWTPGRRRCRSRTACTAWAAAARRSLPHLVLPKAAPARAAGATVWAPILASPRAPSAAPSSTPWRSSCRSTAGPTGAPSTAFRPSRNYPPARPAPLTKRHHHPPE